MKRLRPVRLRAVTRDLREVYRLVKACRLCQEHFPQLLATERFHDDWDGLLSEFLHSVEAEKWFEIDWALLDDLYMWAMQGDGDEEDGEENESISYLAEYLDGIPVKRYGWTDESILNEERPWVHILAGILSDRVQLDADLLIDLDIYDALADEDRGEIWYKLQNRPDEFLRCGEPLCWLPEMADLVCGQTGNELLDNGVELFDFNPMRWRWDSDIDEVKSLYQEAKLTVEHFEQFDRWMGDSLDKAQQMVEALLGWKDASNETNDDE